MSNLAAGSTSLADAVNLWIMDPTVQSLGHRRWVLYPPLQSTGLGAAFGVGYPAYAMWVIGVSGARPPSPEWIAWPPAGFVPYQVTPTASNTSWSFSYPQADFSAATVTMTKNGAPIGVTLQPASGNYGDNTIGWKPSGLPTSPPTTDVRFRVTLSNVRIGGSPRTFVYETIVIDPNRLVAVDEVDEDAALDLRVWPSPTSSAATIAFSATSEDDRVLQIVDVRGRTVRQFTTKSSTERLVWDGRDQSGRRVPPGVYAVRLRIGPSSTWARLVVLGQ